MRTWTFDDPSDYIIPESLTEAVNPMVSKKTCCLNKSVSKREKEKDMQNLV